MFKNTRVLIVWGWIFICIGNITIWSGLWEALQNIYYHVSLETIIEEMAWDNEAYTWDLIFSPFNIVAAIIGIILLKHRHRTVPVIALIGVAVLSCYSTWSNFPEGMRPQSKADVEQLLLWQYWTAGSGWISGFVVIPLLAWGMILTCRKTKVKGLAQSTG